VKKGLSHLNVTLTLLLFIFIIFKDKFVYFAPHLQVSIALFIYPLTFLIPILIFNKYKAKEAKKAIFYSALAIFAFYLVAIIFCSVGSHLDSANISNSLRVIFTPNQLEINNIIIYYPNLFVFGFLIIYILTRLIMISIYDTLKYYSNNYIGFAMALFIAFIIDTMFVVPLYHFSAFFKSSYDMMEVIKFLTANFIVVIFTSAILSLIYPLIYKKKN